MTAPNSITRYWLEQGAAGWRMDVSGDASFPDGYWEAFRGVVKATNPNALTISRDVAEGHGAAARRCAATGSTRR